MKTSDVKPRVQTPPAIAVHRVGCVSFLNAKPLIHGLESRTDLSIRLDVPSRLLKQLETSVVDIALCPVIDYQRSACPLEVVPAGGICCQGPTLTVRLFSRVPLEEITHIHTDPDSHTSIALLKIILSEQYGLAPKIEPYAARHATDHAESNAAASPPQAILLIGDKVVNNPPPDDAYPYELDLGQAWHELTGLPFVFAIWMTRANTDLGDLPTTLNAQRLHNHPRLNEIADRYAHNHGWPPALGRQYLGQLLHYAIGPAQLQAIERFNVLAHHLGLIDHVKPLQIYASA